VTSQAPLERGVLSLDRQRPMATAPGVDGLFRPSQARLPCLAPHPPVPLAGPPPVEGEPYKVTGGRTLPTLLRLWRTPKRQQTGLVRVEGQSEAPPPFVEHRHHTPCSVCALKANDEIVPIASQGCFPL
jgi:hypothetical protein